MKIYYTWDELMKTLKDSLEGLDESSLIEVSSFMLRGKWSYNSNTKEFSQTTYMKYD